MNELLDMISHDIKATEKLLATMPIPKNHVLCIERGYSIHYNHKDKRLWLTCAANWENPVSKHLINWNVASRLYAARHLPQFIKSCQDAIAKAYDENSIKALHDELEEMLSSQYNK